MKRARCWRSYFADQLKGIESAGFDLANFFPDMIASFDPLREGRRPSEYAETVQSANSAREARLAARKAQARRMLIPRFPPVAMRRW